MVMYLFFCMGPTLNRLLGSNYSYTSEFMQYFQFGHIKDTNLDHEGFEVMLQCNSNLCVAVGITIHCLDNRNINEVKTLFVLIMQTTPTLSSSQNQATHHGEWGLFLGCTWLWNSLLAYLRAPQTLSYLKMLYHKSVFIFVFTVSLFSALWQLNLIFLWLETLPPSLHTNTLVVMYISKRDHIVLRWILMNEWRSQKEEDKFIRLREI